VPAFPGSEFVVKEIPGFELLIASMIQAPSVSVERVVVIFEAPEVAVLVTHISGGCCFTFQR
jgi:hypothetical protein